MGTAHPKTTIDTHTHTHILSLTYTLIHKREKKQSNGHRTTEGENKRGMEEERPTKTNPKQGLLCVSVVFNPPASAGDTGSIPGPGRSHMCRNN